MGRSRWVWRRRASFGIASADYSDARARSFATKPSNDGPVTRPSSNRACSSRRRIAANRSLYDAPLPVDTPDEVARSLLARATGLRHLAMLFGEYFCRRDAG